MLGPHIKMVLQLGNDLIKKVTKQRRKNIRGRSLETKKVSGKLHEQIVKYRVPVTIIRQPVPWCHPSSLQRLPMWCPIRASQGFIPLNANGPFKIH